MARRSVRIDTEAVDRLRTAKKWDQQQLARKARVSQTTVSRMERGGERETFDVATAQKVADALGVPLADIAVPAESPPPDGLGKIAQAGAYDGLRALAERFGDPRLRLAFYDFLSFADDITPDEAAGIAETLEAIVERKKAGGG